MKFTTSTALICLSLALVASTHELPSRYFRARSGDQFVGGKCSTDSDCAQGCCGFATGQCAGPAFAQESGSNAKGCGHGNPKPNCNVAAALNLNDCINGAENGDITSAEIQDKAEFVAKLDGIKFTKVSGGSGGSKTTAAKKASSTKAATSNNNASSGGGKTSLTALADKQNSKQFVTGSCKSDTDCQQGCCAFKTGTCAGPGIAQTRESSGGCGFGNQSPNCDVANALNLGVCVKGAKNGDSKSVGVQQAAAFTARLDNLPFDPSV